MKYTTKYLVLTLVLFLSACFAQPAKADARDDKIIQATSAFSALDFEGALKILEKAFAQSGNGKQELTRIYSLGALCLVSLGRLDEAKRSFEAVLSIDPSYRLDDDVSPRFRKPFFDVLKKGVPRLAVDVSLPSPLLIGKPVSVRVSLLADPAQISKKLVFRFKRKGQDKFSSISVNLKLAKTKSFYLPPGIWDNGNRQPLLWYAQLQNRFKGILLAKGSADNPLVLDVTSPPPKSITALSSVAEQASHEEKHQQSWYKRWWVWAIAGGVAAAVAGGSAAAIYLGADSPKQRDFTLDIQ